jgi:ribonuclease III
MKRPPLEQLEKILGHTFSDKELVLGALTHSSAGGEKNYERLEFLGDRVLGLVISEILFEKFPNEKEGDLAKRLAALAQGELLAEIAAEMGLGPHVILSQAEAQAGGAENENILGDVFEALIGALYLDAGYPVCRALIEKQWSSRFDAMKAPPQHPKTIVQEWAQGKGLPLPTYKIVNQRGPDHEPIFEVELVVKGCAAARAEGHSRQEAEKEAARIFVQQMKDKK